ncbi:MAG: 50S ribosomal protein L25 [Chloroflexi bacterium]|nr:50S ribosomal protein L25 [Chloroflexota bacterium]
MAQTLTLEAQSRDTQSTPRALRREGFVPGVLYGNQFDSVALQIPERALSRVLNTVGTTRLFSLSVSDRSLSETVLVRAVQRHPVTGSLLHIDLYRIVAGQAITTAVPVRAHGEAPATEEGGVVSLLLNELEIECLPADLPEQIVVDLSALTEMDSVIYVSDLSLPEGVTALIDAEAVVARVLAPRAAEEEEEAEGAEEMIEGEVEAQAEAPGEESEE